MTTYKFDAYGTIDRPDTMALDMDETFGEVSEVTFTVAGVLTTPVARYDVDIDAVLWEFASDQANGGRVDGLNWDEVPDLVPANRTEK